MTEGSGGRIGVGMVGHAFMGAVHSHAWRTAHRFFDLPVTPELAVLGGRDLARAGLHGVFLAVATLFGFAPGLTVAIGLFLLVDARLDSAVLGGLRCRFLLFSVPLHACETENRCPRSGTSRVTARFCVRRNVQWRTNRANRKRRRQARLA